MAKKESLNFEEALERLETIIEEIDNDDKPLEEAIKLYEEGISLAGQCTEKLEKAELRIEEITPEQDQS